MTLWSVVVPVVVLVVEAAGARLDTVGEVVVAVVVVVEVVAFPVAAAKKAGNLSPGLMAITMPFWQWPVWRQYTQTGLRSTTWKRAVGRESLVALSATGRLPEGIRLKRSVRKGGG